MKSWSILLALGVIALATGAAMVLLQYHHTVGLGALGLGALLLAAGAGMAYLDRKTVKVQDQKIAVPAKRQGGLRKALIAVVVIVAIGVATFYGTSYLGSIQPGNSFSSLSISSTTSSQISNSTTFTSTTTPILHIFNLVSSNLNVTGNDIVLNASYTNNDTATHSVNFYLATSFKNGTLYTTGYLFFPTNNGSQVQPNSPFQVNVDLGTFFPAGSYYMTFYVIDATTVQQISVTSNIPFTIAPPQA
jgi:hypothetical protein